MPSAQRIRIYLVLFNLLFGSLIGALTARVPAFTSLGMPPFLWLVAGLFAFEMCAGLLLGCPSRHTVEHALASSGPSGVARQLLRGDFRDGMGPIKPR